MVTRRREELKEKKPNSHPQTGLKSPSLNRAGTWWSLWMLNAVNNILGHCYYWFMTFLFYLVHLQSHRIFSHIACSLSPCFRFVLCDLCALCNERNKTRAIWNWNISFWNCTCNIFGSSFLAHIQNRNFYYLMRKILIKTPKLGTRHQLTT